MSDGAQSFSYDENGRLTSAGDRSYSYALNDRLIALSQPGLSATFAYNGDGVRLAQTKNGSETRYLVDTQRSYSEVVGAITPESETWYLLGLDILGQQQGSDWSYYAYDGLGSVRLALDINGSPRAGMRYEPYGQPAASWGTPPALGFTGEWTDSSGLLYLRARYLDPSSATFLSRDPFEGLPTRALSRNGYSWVEGNPVNYVDPSGEFLLASGVLVAAGVVGALLLLSALGQHMNQTRDTMPDLARAMDDYCLPLGLIPGTGIALGIAQAAAGIAAGGADARAREQSNARATAQATAQANSTSIAPPMVTAVPTPGSYGRVYATYTKYNTQTQRYYSGRTSAVINLNLPLEPQAEAAVNARDANHHIDEDLEPTGPGFSRARLDVFTVGYAIDYNQRYSDAGYLAIRGREQQLIDYYGAQRAAQLGIRNFRGGAQSDTHPGIPLTENRIRGVARDNTFGMVFHQSANIAFGELAPFTGN